MKKIFFLGVVQFLLPFNKVFCSEEGLKVLHSIEKNTKVYQSITHVTSNPFYITMPYGSDSVLLHFDTLLMKDYKVKSVYLVYSQYCVGGAEKQAIVNTKRLNKLKRLMPDLFEDTSITWRGALLNNTKEPETAKNAFHGFIVCYEGDISYDDIVLDKILKGKYALADYMELCNAYSSVLDKESGKYKKTHDLAIYNTLERNKNWNKMLIVTDVTGSMNPYTYQLLLWYKLNEIENKVSSFVFFNDGDNKLDKDKKIGDVGGVYMALNTQLDSVVALMRLAKKSGDGGDSEENDVEALIKGIEVCPSCNEVVLIADNNMRPRDLVLLKEIEIPIRVILCGTYFGINREYLNLAKSTGGSVHTVEKDIDNLATMHEGEIIELNGFMYILKEGGFEPYKPASSL